MPVKMVMEDGIRMSAQLAKPVDCWCWRLKGRRVGCGAAGNVSPHVQVDSVASNCHSRALKY